jgi:alpha-beta hydrolase superfamily lysophospholipase
MINKDGGAVMKKEEFYFDSRDGSSKIHAVKWLPDDGKAVCIFQIIHGMAEHIERYEAFAEFLTQQGMIVVGDNHLGHGETVVKNNGIKGYFCENDPATVLVRDEHRLKKTMQQEYPGIPYIILGHSMGSFIMRNYLCKYGTGIDGAIIMGTGMPSKGLLRFSRFLAGAQKVFQGSKHVSMMLNGASFSGYLDRIPDHKTPFDWLSTDEDNVQRYIADPDCGFPFTVNGYQTLFQLIWNLHDQKNLDRMPKDMPILITSGSDDPVGGYGKAPAELYSRYKSMGMTAVSFKLYDGDRHEILNEKNKKQVWEDIAKWVQQTLR